MVERICAHPGCLCVVNDGDAYCSDYCREEGGQAVGLCECGHPDCK